jgi:hypothetical protein
MTVILSFLCAGFFVHHITYLALVNFDYGYNMQANIVVGMLCNFTWFTYVTDKINILYKLLIKPCYVSAVSGIANAMGWFIWCFYYRKSQPYVWRCALFVLLAGVCMIFEVMDFPPLLWVIDAHSLWHLATAALPFLFYRYVGLHILTILSRLSIARAIIQQK